MVLTVNDVEKYIARFEKTVKDPRKRSLKRLDIARLYKDAKCFEQAKESAREYLKVNQNDYRAYNLLGAVNEKLEQWNDALKCYKRSIEIQRSQKDILIKIVEVYSRASHGEPEVAKVWADKAENIMPSHPAIFNLKWSLLSNCEEKDFSEMEDLLAQELVRRPRDPKLHVKLLELYMEQDDYEEAYAHCKSLLASQVFQNDQEWLLCSAEVFKQFHEKFPENDESIIAFMHYTRVLCCLLDVVLKTSSLVLAKDIFQRLDQAGSKIHLQETSAMSSDVQNEFEVFRNEIRGQVYFYLAALFLKMAQETETPWAYAVRLSTACLAVSCSIGVPNKKAAWLQLTSPPDNQKMIWYVMACVRRSQTDHLMLSFEREFGKDWVQTRVSDICTEPGKAEIFQQLYGEKRSHQKSFLVMDKEFSMTEYQMPDLEELMSYDQVAMKENPGNLELLIWIGINCQFDSSSFKTEAFKVISELFFQMQFEVNDMQNCAPFTLSTMDLEVFIEAVIYSGVDRMMFNEGEKKTEHEPPFLPLPISGSLCINAQSDWWDAAFRLHTGKTWHVSTSKLKSILQRGLETIRLIGNHGIDPIILKHISEMFLNKADEIQDDRENEWTNQLTLESYRRRGFLYGDEALKLLEINESDLETAQPKAPLIPPLIKSIDENERAEMIESLTSVLANAAFRNDECDKALDYLNGLQTADSAHMQAQIYRDLASRENHTNVEGLRSHLSYLRKSRDMLQSCLQRLDKTQVALHEKVQAEIDEIKEAIAEQSGISAIPRKALDLRYSSDDTEDEQDIFRENENTQDESTTEAKLALENSILHEQLAVRNHEFSVLASRIHKLEREMFEMRANQSGNESVIKPRQDSSVNTDESSSSAVYVPKDDLTSGSGNLTPRLEPEMSWDPFSPAPVFPVGFFSGLVDTVEKIDEETETEVRAESESPPPASLTVKNKTPDTSGRDENVSRGEDDASFGDTLHVEPLVSLTRKSDLKTGEEDEEVVFKELAKLYRLHEGQWKERGVGDLKILLNKTASKARILMRRDKVFKVCANHLLTDDMTLTKKAENLNTYVWYTPADISEEEPTAETFAVKFKTEEIAKKFSKAFERYQSVGSSEKEDAEKVLLSEKKEQKQAGVLPSKEVEKEQIGMAAGGNTFELAKFTESKEESAKFDAGKFSFKLGSDATAQNDEGQKEVKLEQSSTTPKFDFKSPGRSVGFVLDPSKFKFEFGGQNTDEAKDSQKPSSTANPFLAAFQNLASSKPFSFGQVEDRSHAPSSSSPLQAPAQASTPLGANVFRGTNLALAESTPNSAVFGSSSFTSPDVVYGGHQPGQDFRVNDYFNAPAQGPSITNNQVTDQARYFQSEWESMQDRYYDAAAAAYDANNQYYDDDSFYQNDDYYNDGEYYTAEDVYYRDGDEAYYANSEQGFAYYDQEPPQNIPPADSDANSDRLSPQNEGAAPSDELVPHVVQMIDDDIFVTYVKKASFAQRAKASRFQLPPNFYAPSPYPPCPGCRGCGAEEPVIKRFDLSNPISFWARDASKVEQKAVVFGAEASKESLGDTTFKDASQKFLSFADLVANEKAKDASRSLQKTAVFGAEASKESLGDATFKDTSQKFLSFADLVGSKNQGTFATNTSGNKAFTGAGAMLFAAKEESEEREFDPTFKPIVQLEKKEDLKTGEEGYEDLFKSRAKLFRFDFDAKQWKERGVGEMRLSYNPETSYCRVIMRRDQVLKLCANHPVMPDIVLKPHGMSATSWVWVSGADYSEGEPQMQQFAVRFKNKDVADEFKRVFQDCQKRIVKYLDDLERAKTEGACAMVGGERTKTDNDASQGKQILTHAAAAFQSKPDADAAADDLLVTFVKEPSSYEERKADRLLLPKSFFASSSVPPCHGCSGCKKDAGVKGTDKIDGSFMFAAPSSKKEEKNTFLSFADLASSSTDNSIAFESSKKGFFGAGTTLFTSPKQDEDPNAFDPTFKPIVELTKKEELKTGEEGYEDLFKNRAKLFRFDFDAKQWKERGVGEMRLSYNPETSYCRVIMRRDQVLKLCANHPVMPDIVLKPHEMSATSWVWVSGADYSEGEPQMQQFAVRFKNKDVADEFKRVFQQCQGIIKTYLEANKLPLTQLPTDEKDKATSEDEVVPGNDTKHSKEVKFGNEARSKVDSDIKLGQDSGISVKFSSSFASSSASTKAGNDAVTSSAREDERTKSDEPSFTSTSLNAAWTCSSCFATNNQDGLNCSSCKATKPTGTFFGMPAAGGLFSAPTFNFGLSAVNSSFGVIKFGTKDDTGQETVAAAEKEESKAETTASESSDEEINVWVCVECSIENLSENETCIACNASKPSVKEKSNAEPTKSTEKKLFNAFKPKEGAWECPSCMLQNDKDKGSCISCSTEKPIWKSSIATSTIIEPQKSTGSKLFGAFKPKEGAWECPACMLQNDKDKDKCISCQTQKPTGKSSIATSAIIEPQKSTGSKPFGAFKPKEGAWECPSCMLQNDKDKDRCISCSTEKPIGKSSIATSAIIEPQKGARSKLFGAFKAKEGAWECPSCMLQNDKDKDRCISCSTEKPIGKSSIATSAIIEPQKGARSKLFGAFKAKEGAWECPTCMLQNDNDKDKCISCQTGKPIWKSSIATSAIIEPQKGTGSKPFGVFKPKDGAWKCPSCMLQNDKEKDKCISCQTQKPTGKSSIATSAIIESQIGTGSKPFGAFKPKEGAWECPSCMLQNDKDKDKCISCQTEKPIWKSSIATSTIIVPQKSTGSKPFGAFKPKEGAWECPSCMLQNDKDKDKCISCNHANPSKAPSPLNMPLFTQKNNGSAFFGAKTTNLFQADSNAPPNPSFTMPFFAINANQDHSTEKDVESWECPTCSVKNSQQNAACENCKTENPSAPKERTSPQIVLRRSPLSTGNNPLLAFQQNAEQNTDELSLFAAPADKSADQISGNPLFGTPSQPKTGIVKDFWTSGQFKFGDSSPFSTPAQRNESPDKTLFFTPASSTFMTPKSGSVSLVADPTLSAQATPSRPATTPKTPESPTKDEGGIVCSPLVSLQRLRDQRTGEEDENVLFCEKAKLYRFDAEVKQWKERGIGELKILQKLGALNKYRLLMRRDQIRKLCANHALIPGMTLKGMPSSEKMKIWTTNADFADEEVKKETFVVRFKSLEVLEKFELAFHKAIEEAGNEEEGGIAKVDEDKAKSAGAEEDRRKTDEKDTKKETAERVNDIDLQLTEVVLPSTENQNKAEKLLLPKEFFNVSRTEVIDGKDTVEDVEFKTPVKAKEQKSLVEIFASPKVSLFGSGSDVTPNLEPRSPEKFSEDCSASIAPIVQLDQVQTETGEENEVVLFCDKAKLYRYEAAGPEWKERGFGDLKILKNAYNDSARIIMRRDQVKKVCLNHSVIAGMKLEYMANKRNTLIWFTHADYAEEEAKAEKFAARFKNEEVVKRFKECFDGVLKDEVSANEDIDRVKEGDMQPDADAVPRPKVVVLPEVERRQEVTARAEGDKQKDNAVGKEPDSLKENSSTVETVGSFESFLTKNQGHSFFGVSKDGSNGQSSAESSASTFTRPTSSGLPFFTFGTATGIAFDSSKDGEKSEFSWPVTGNLFSFGSMGSSSQSDLARAVDESKDATDQGASENVPNDYPSAGLFDFQWTKSDSSKGPFSFASTAVEDVSNVDRKQENKKAAFSFALSGGDGKNKAPVFDLGLRKDFAKAGVEEVKDEVLNSPEKLEEKEVYDPSEAIVTLQKVESSSGEENEVPVFSEWAKAYRFVAESRQWKERGRGDVKILCHTVTGQYRLLMRRDQVKKVAINHALAKDMKLELNSTTKNSWIWFTSADFADEVAKPEKLAIRFRNEEISMRFKDAFDAAVEKLNSALKVELAYNETPQDETSPVKLNEMQKCCANAETSILKPDDEVTITFVKEPTDAELKHATCLLLPRTFFAPISKLPSKKQSQVLQAKNEASATATQPPLNNQVMSSFNLTGGGLSFADLISQPSGAFSGFGSSPDNQRGFKGQGSALFSKGRKDNENRVDDGEEDYLDFTPIVSLTKTETKTGEEEEEVKFAERCKLYRFDKDVNQWKERGVGDMKILCKKNENTSRIIMRRDVVFKLGANHLIQPGMNLTSKQGIETTWVWKSNADISDDVAREETFTVKFKTAEIGRKFAQVFEECLAQAGKGEEVEGRSDEDGNVLEQGDSSVQIPGNQSDSLVSGSRGEYLMPGNQGNSSISGNQEDCSNSLISSQGDSSKRIPEDAGHSTTQDTSHPETEEKKESMGSTFGSAFSGLDFSALAKSDSTAFQNTSIGGFANAGARLFGSKEAEAEEQDPRVEAIVQLEKVETKSGEEDEVVMFENKVKLYRFCKATNQWKERGIGVLKLLRHKKTNDGRLVMRRDVVFKLAANHSLTKGMKLDVMKSATRTLIWKTVADISDDEPTESMFAAKFRSDDVISEFTHAFEALCSGEEVQLREQGNAAGNNKQEARGNEQPVIGSCSPDISKALQKYLDGN